ncbi:hypothetical protein GCM10020367_18090 [Streptomyces sannanensis]|uniref:Uncharacterized protein n=1 Tax=Streptomyces sannanensis TaxID=285536 RepID=A0ABP6S887_9ACTN
MSALSPEPALSVLPSAAPLSADGPQRKPGLYDSWWTVAAAAVLACLALTCCIWTSVHLRVDPALHTVALFLHLASLVLGFGAVMVADYYGLLWMSGRCGLQDMLGATSRLHTPIWAGLAGLVTTGMMLHPDLSSPLTLTKLALVAVLTVNGLQAGLLNRRMKQRQSDLRPGARLGTGLLAWGATTATVSQIGWWGAMLIGFLNSSR